MLSEEGMSDACLELLEGDRLFLEADAQVTGATDVLSFLRGGFKRDPTGGIVSPLGVAAKGKQLRQAKRSFNATTLAQVCNMAESLGVPMAWKKMDDLDMKEFEK